MTKVLVGRLNHGKKKIIKLVKSAVRILKCICDGTLTNTNWAKIRSMLASCRRCCRFFKSSKGNNFVVSAQIYNCTKRIKWAFLLKVSLLVYVLKTLCPMTLYNVYWSPTPILDKLYSFENETFHHTINILLYWIYYSGLNFSFLTEFAFQGWLVILG